MKHISLTQLNYLIATEVMGYAVHCRNTLLYVPKGKENSICTGGIVSTDFDPARNLNQAWEAAETAGKDPCVFKDINGYCAEFAHPGDANSEWELSPAIALCVAALAAKGIRVKVFESSRNP